MMKESGSGFISLTNGSRSGHWLNVIHLIISAERIKSLSSCFKNYEIIMICNVKEEFVRGCLEDKDLLSRICG